MKYTAAVERNDDPRVRTTSQTPQTQVAPVLVLSDDEFEQYVGELREAWEGLWER